MRVFRSTTLVCVLVSLVACQAPTAALRHVTPMADLSAYYGEPPAAVLTIHGQVQRAGVGTSTWIVSKTGDEVLLSHGDAFGLVTPNQALMTTSPFTATLVLPIPVPPSQLAYSLVATTGLEKQEFPDFATIKWEPYRPAETSLRLEPQQEVGFELSPGSYVLAAFAEWKDLGDVEYGFWIRVGVPSDAEMLTVTPAKTPTAVPTEAPTRAPEPVTEVDLLAATEALRRYFSLLQAGHYDEAVQYYGGDYDILRDWNPSVPTDAYAALFQRGCEVNGLQCLEVRRIVKTTVLPTQFRFTVEFVTKEGELFVRAPCCGATGTEMPSQSQFIFTVVKVNGEFRVRELPVYVP